MTLKRMTGNRRG